MIPPPDVKQWTFAMYLNFVLSLGWSNLKFRFHYISLERDANGRFKDDDLANILQNATDWPAGAYGARGIPGAMRVIEIMSIEQARSWGSCSVSSNVYDNSVLDAEAMAD